MPDPVLTDCNVVGPYCILIHHTDAPEIVE
jgi:hypothetical protein